MKLSVLKSLLFFVFVFQIPHAVPSTGADIHSGSIASSTTAGTDDVPTAGGSANPIEACESAAVEAEQASVGMDMTSYALVGQAVTGAVSAAKGSSAKVAHQGNMAIQGTLSAVALKRCAACQTAIGACETACDSSTQCKGYTDPPQASIPTLSDCTTTLQAKHKECMALKTPCGQACLQGGLSGIQALTSLLAAKALGDCPEGADNCVKNPEKNSTEKEEAKKPPAPNMMAGGQGPGMGMPNPWGDGKSSNEKTDPILPPEDGTQALAGNKDDKKKRGEGRENPVAGSDYSDGGEGPGSLASLGPLGGSRKGASAPNSGAFNYGKKPGQSNGAGMFAGNRDDGGDEELDEEKRYPGSYSSSAGFGNSQGGYGSPAGSAGRGGYGGRGGKGYGSSAFNGKRQLAMNNKRTDTFGKGKSDGSIFTQMSQFIHKVCHGEMQCH